MVTTASNVWTMTAANGLTASSTHSFRVDYVTTDGRKSPLSPSASGTTWSGATITAFRLNGWRQYYGLHFVNWPIQCECAADAWWTKSVAGVPERRQSDESRHLAANSLEQYAGRIVPQLEHAAGIHLSGAGGDKPGRVEQSGVAAFRRRHHRFDFRWQEFCRLLSRNAPAPVNRV